MVRTVGRWRSRTKLLGWARVREVAVPCYALALIV